MAENKKQFSPEEFKMKFRAFIAVLAVLIGSLFMAFALFSETASKSEHTGTILGFLMGTMLTLVLTYYFGSSDTAPDEPKQINLKGD